MSTDDMLHPTPDRLEALVEGALDDSDRVVVESHLVTCTRCQAEVEEWRSVFAALASLPRIEPSAGFADRVMARVQLRQPWTVRLAEMLGRLIPSSTGGWMLATALLALPVVVTGGALAWLLSRPSITPEALWLFVRERAADGVMSLAGRAGTAVLESNTALWLWESATSLLANVGTLELGAVAAVFAMMTVLSLWILYDNLFRSSTREKHYVTYCI